MKAFLFGTLACAAAAIAAGYYLTPTSAANPAEPTPVATAVAAPVPAAPKPERLVAHEWGTFTSFSGSNGVPVGFTPNNEDLPFFVYHQTNPFTKSGRLALNGLISMETPVIYFYTDRETKVSVKVDFPRGWITEWYPFAALAPNSLAVKGQGGGQTIRWDARLVPGEPVQFPIDKGRAKNPYYHARETDAVALQTEMPVTADSREFFELRGGAVTQREKYLFYRGVGTFPPPVTVKALGGDRVQVVNSGATVSGAVLVNVRGGKIGFRPVGELPAGGTVDSSIPETNGSRAALGAFLVKELTSAGLYEKEAQAMVKTWDAAWFGEEGTRVLYLVPRAKTDEVLPVTINPQPTELVRVLVGRHDFVTPEQEASAERQVRRIQAAQAELNAAQQELAKLGRFSNEAQTQAAKRLETAAAAAGVAGAALAR